MKAVPIVLTVNALIRSLASLMSARPVAVTSSEETVMGKWTQFTKQHDSYDKHHGKKNDRKHGGRDGRGRN
jgi:predicted RND superfamily exporter protein